MKPSRASASGLRVHASPDMVRVYVTTSTLHWTLVLPDPGPTFDVMQFQARSLDAHTSALVELRMEGDRYRRHLVALRQAAGCEIPVHCESIVLAIRDLLCPIFDLSASLREETVPASESLGIHPLRLTPVMPRGA